MNKLLLTFSAAALALLSACSSNEPVNAPDTPSYDKEALLQSLSSKRTLDEAAEIALDAIGMLPQSGSRSGGRSFSKLNVKYGISTSLSRSIGPDTLMYVFNFDDNQGFAVVAADKTVPGLIAVTELGSYDPETTPDTPGLALYMDMTKNYLIQRTDSFWLRDSFPLKDIDPLLPDPDDDDDGVIKDLAEYRVFTDTLSKEDCFPNFHLYWGQTYPEGIECTNKSAGCANLATFIVMSYFELPETLALTYKSPVETLSIDWTEIKGHYHSGYFSKNNKDLCDYLYPENHSNIAKICRELVYRSGSDDSELYSTGTTPNQLLSLLNNLGFRTSTSFLSYKNFDNGYILRNGGKIIVKGKNKVANKGMHCWVIDGFKYFTIQSGEYIREKGKDWVLTNLHPVQNVKLNHMNWGWRGEANGYFSESVFSVLSGYSYDNGYPESDESYTNVEFISVFKN